MPIPIHSERRKGGTRALVGGLQRCIWKGTTRCEPRAIQKGGTRAPVGGLQRCIWKGATRCAPHAIHKRGRSSSYDENQEYANVSVAYRDSRCCLYYRMLATIIIGWGHDRTHGELDGSRSFRHGCRHQRHHHRDLQRGDEPCDDCRSELYGGGRRDSRDRNSHL
jgi:hypothetical protein